LGTGRRKADSAEHGTCEQTEGFEGFHLIRSFGVARENRTTAGSALGSCRGKHLIFPLGQQAPKDVPQAPGLHLHPRSGARGTVPPRALIGEGAAGSGFQVGLEGVSLVGVGQAEFHIGGESDVGAEARYCVRFPPMGGVMERNLSMNHDPELLRQFAQDRPEAGFTAGVKPGKST
jgi:hypothetical protein